MQNYKIKVVNKEESKEAQELLFKLGYDWGELGKSLVDVEFWHFIANHMNTNQLFYCHNTHFNAESQKEITLPQLRDLVVLHRNDVGDATHITNMSAVEFGVQREYYVGESVFLFHDGKWLKSPYISLDNCEEKLLPITKEQPQMTWQDALRAVADGKEVEVDSISDGWLDVTTCCIELLQELENFRIKPQTIFLNGGNYTKEQLLKITGEME